MVYWLVGVPLQGKRDAALNNLKQKLQNQKTCDVFEFKIPSKLKFGTLDDLYALSDDLHKYDTSIEQVCQKVVRTLQEMLELQQDAKQDAQKLIQNFSAEIMLQDDNSVPVEMYLHYYQWDENQYLVSKSLKELADTIYKKNVKLDEELKAKLGEYTAIKTAIGAMERKSTGPLTTRPLDGLIEEHHIVNSEYLQTLFVIVPKSAQKEWTTGYENLGNCEMIVPGSSELIYEDSDYCLYNVVLIRKIASDFKSACVKHKFVVREFEFDKQKFDMSKLESSDLEAKRDKIKKDLLDWCKIAFSECFSSWIHLKCIRLFAESVLRYGVPPNNLYALLKVPSRNETRVHRVLRDEYKSILDDGFNAGGNVDEAALAMVSGIEFHPYVLLTVNTTNMPLLKLA